MGDALITRRGKYVEPPLIIDPGLIVMFYGVIDTIPDGWQLCDGTNNTPDLRNKFILGGGGSYAIGATGGSADSILPAHTHETVTNTEGGHTHGYRLNEGYTGSVGGGVTSTLGSFGYWKNPYYGLGLPGAGAHTHSTSISSAGTTGTGKNLPPYHSLFYIIKLEEV